MKSSITIGEVVSKLNSWAPSVYQEGYDNSGLLVGDTSVDVTGILVTLDSTEDVIDEAVAKGCNMIVAHHPIVFSGLKSLTGKSYVERTVIKAIQQNIALFAVHTNLDNVHTGVNKRIADVIGIENPKVLQPKNGVLFKLNVFVPRDKTEELSKALFDAGAGEIGNYDSCSFANEGQGTFKANESATPYVGEKGELHKEQENMVSVIVPKHALNGVIKSLKQAHPYEEPAYDIYKLENSNPLIGAGMFGELEQQESTIEFLKRIKESFKTGVVRHTKISSKTIKRVAWCGGAGSFLLKEAKRANADVFITGDFKYHEFFDAEDEIIIADIGHFESEQFTKDLIADFLVQNFSTFAVRLSEVNTNPVHYL